MATSKGRQAIWQWWMVAYIATSLTLSLAAAYVLHRHSILTSVFDLQFCVGDTAEHLITGLGVSCYEHMFPWPGDILLLHSARMPVATFYAAAAALTLGPEHLLAAMLLKTFLLLVPVYAMAGLVLKRCGRSTGRYLPWVAVLAVPFLIPSFLSSVVTMEAEEGFSYAFLAVAFTLIAFGPLRDSRLPLRRTVLYDIAVAAALGLLYLTKSSMIVVVAVLLLFYVLQIGTAWRKLCVVLLVTAAPFGWAIRQHGVSDRYTLGTSWDGSNLHKGNNQTFLLHYPPAPYSNLDFYDSEVAPPRPLGTEWAYSDWQTHAALQFMRSHPRETVIGWEKKVYVLFFSLHTYGNSPHGLPAGVTLAGMILLRALLWSALALSAFVAVRRQGAARGTGLLFLAMVMAVTVPYILGFGFTRHISVLIYPSAVLLCLLLSGTVPVTRQGTVTEKP